MKLLALFFSSLSFLVAFDITKVEVSDYKIANGKTVLLEFLPQSGIVYKSVKVGKKIFQVFDKPKNKSFKYALIPFSYYEKPENKTLHISYLQNKKLKNETMLLKVVDGQYEKEEITVSSSKVNPQSKEVKKRVSKEYAEAMKIYNTVTPKSYISSGFIEPMSSKITSSFGKARIYNGSLKGYHSGTDYRAKVGTPIIAANDGRVVLVKDRFYSGGTVLLDHGEGIYTCYFHMSSFSVAKNQLVKKGEKLGLSGKSGRVTGPHLHFSARINGIQVDPLQLIALMNKNLLNNKGTKQ
ncbi:MAG: M23 family metallopeptidase [Campylobacterota bacterium]|nr:M23 family metallopeptidase [Campylobacterota bacterium]